MQPEEISNQKYGWKKGDLKETGLSNTIKTGHYKITKENDTNI